MNIVLFLMNPQVHMTADALRMRTRRLCEKKPSGRYQIDPKIAEKFKEGGESREVLEMALLECIAKWGTGRDAYKRIKACRAPVYYI